MIKMNKSLILFFLWTVPLLAVAPSEPDACSNIGYRVYGEFLYLQPNASNLYYATQANPKNPALASPLLQANWFSHEITPAYHPAFDLRGEFVFKNQEMNLSLNWERFTGSDIERLALENGIAMVGPIFDIGPDAEVYILAKGKAVFRFDLANIALEKQFFSKDQWKIELCTGASFARIKQYLRNQYSSGGGSFERLIKSPSLFTGGGLLFGCNLDYELFKQFHLTSSSFASLLMGQMKNHTAYRSFSPSITAAGNPQPNTEKTRVANRAQIVPGFEEKLGFSYDFPFRCGNVSLEAGYQLQCYLNAIQSFDLSGIVNADDLPFSSTDGYYAQSFQRTLSNFMLSGPYFNMNISF